MRCVLVLVLLGSVASAEGISQAEKEYRESVAEAKAVYEQQVEAAKNKLVKDYEAEIKKATMAGDLDEALELRKGLSAALSDKTSGELKQKLIGTRWTWVRSARITFHADGSVSGGLGGSVGIWRAMSSNVAVIRWPNGFIDSLVFNEKFTKFDAVGLGIPGNLKPGVTGVQVR